jgi:SulP family sulfate permease
VLAGITVAVVALPLALGFGVASGMGATAGLITAIVAGVFAAIFGGSNVQVSGPTGAMTVVLIPIVATHGVAGVATVAVIAGVLVMAMGLFRLGSLVALIPWPVIEGFTVGIAVIIALQQVPIAVGATPSTSGTALENAWDAITSLSPASIPAVTVTAATVAVMVLVTRLRRTLPSSLIAVVAVTGLVIVTGAAVVTVGVIPNELPAPSVPPLSIAAIQGLFGSAIAVAALAAIESLLSAKVADGMSDVRPTNPDRELVGQGLANVASGFFGGMPATGAIARTAVNVRAGAGSRLAAITHSGVLLLIVLAASALVALIPLATLAGVLIVTAVKMVDHQAIGSVMRSTRADRVICGLTAICTVAFDLVVAIEVGIVLAGALALITLARASGASLEALPDLDDFVDTDTEHQLLQRHIAIYRIDGSLFFGAAQRFLDELTAVSDVQVVIIRMSGVGMIDSTGAQALGEVVRHLQGRDVVVLFKGLKPEHEQLLTALGVLDAEPEQTHSFASLPEAIEHARTHVAAGHN